MNTSEDIKWMVYRHTSPSGKVYIGITKNSTIRRWGKKGNGYNHSAYFKNAIEKYGWDNIKHEVLFTNLSEERAKKLEIDLIRHYKNLGISYNCTDGGDGTLGWHPSKELKERWSRMRKGRIITEEWKKHLSEACKGKKMPEGHGKQAGLMAKLKFSKPVVQLSLEGDYIRDFYSTKEASRFFGEGKGEAYIAACCKNKAHSAMNYIWMYKSDYNKFLESGTLEQYIKEKVERAKNRYKHKRTEEWNRHNSEARKGKQYNTPEHMSMLIKLGQEMAKKCVMQLTSDGNPIAVFRSAVEINEKLGFNRSGISNCCNHRCNTYKGYKWKFISKEEYEEYKLRLTA